MNQLDGYNVMLVIHSTPDHSCFENFELFTNDPSLNLLYGMCQDRLVGMTKQWPLKLIQNSVHHNYIHVYSIR